MTRFTEDLTAAIGDGPIADAKRRIENTLERLGALNGRLSHVQRQQIVDVVLTTENVFWDSKVKETDENTDRKRSSAILKRLRRSRRTR